MPNFHNFHGCKAGEALLWEYDGRTINLIVKCVHEDGRADVITVFDSAGYIITGEEWVAVTDEERYRRDPVQPIEPEHGVVGIITNERRV